MITFRKIHEFIFSSFRVNDVSRFLGELEAETIKKAIIVKRSWIFGFFQSLIFILILAIMGINIYLMFRDISSLLLFYGLVGFIVINIIFAIFSSIIYISRFHRVHMRESVLTGVHDIELMRQAMLEEESIFARFFNQMTTNYYIFILITLGYIYYLLFVQVDPLDMYIIAEILLLIIQILLLRLYRSHMIDLEMDYVIVIPNRVYFMDQIGVYKRTQSIKWVTNIRLVTSSYPSWFASLCNYGTIEIIVKSDTPAIATSYHMRYVDNPIEIVNQINRLIEKEGGIGT